MLGIGAGEFMVVAVVMLIAVGPQRLPALMRTVGRAMREVRKGTRELRDAMGIDEALYGDDIPRPRRPLPPPGQTLPTRAQAASDPSQTPAASSEAKPSGLANPAGPSQPGPAQMESDQAEEVQLKTERVRADD